MRSAPEWDDWPLEVRDALEQAAAAGVAQDLLRTHYLRQVLQAFEERGVRCILTKGEALAKMQYPIAGTRTRSDTDLFIPIADIAVVRDLMLRLGYRIYPPIYKSHQFTAVRSDDPAGPVRFDIHWRILNDPRFALTLTFEEAWDRSVELTGMGPACALGNADALLVACMHRHANRRHDPDRLIWIYDIHGLVGSMRQAEISQFVEYAVAAGVQDCCIEGLSRAQDWLRTPVDDGVFECLEARTRDVPGPWRRFVSRWVLMLRDFRELPTPGARVELFRELVSADGGQLLARYDKDSRWWLPVLYLRRIFEGVLGREAFSRKPPG
jgi:hypothetical protein